MQVIEKKLSELKPYENNPRKNDDAVAYVANSIKEFGFKVPLVIDKDGVIVAGHTRYKAAKKLKMKSLPCVIADDLTDEQVKAFRLADNQTAAIAEWDMPKLDLELGEIDLDMSQFGFDLDESLLGGNTITDDDFEVEPPTEPKAKFGDVYQLGNHRLMCGDSTNADNVAKLMDGQKVELLLTDPPYGVKRDKGFDGCGGFSGKGKPIKRRKYDDDWDSEPISKETLINSFLPLPSLFPSCCVRCRST